MPMTIQEQIKNVADLSELLGTYKNHRKFGKNIYSKEWVEFFKVELNKIKDANSNTGWSLGWGSEFNTVIQELIKFIDEYFADLLNYKEFLKKRKKIIKNNIYKIPIDIEKLDGTGLSIIKKNMEIDKCDEVKKMNLDEGSGSEHQKKWEKICNNLKRYTLKEIKGTSNFLTNTIDNIKNQIVNDATDTPKNREKLDSDLKKLEEKKKIFFTELQTIYKKDDWNKFREAYEAKHFTFSERENKFISDARTFQ